MMRLTILGLGTMGAGVAKRLIAAGNEVTVWNRTASTSQAFAQSESARSAVDLASAVANADVVLSFLADDEASRSVWSNALAACSPTTLVVECSTVSPERAEEFTAEANNSGLQAMVALMVGSKPQAEGGMLTFLVGGDEGAMPQLAQVLEPASTSVRFVGLPKIAATLKLSINTILATQLVGMAEIKQITEALGMGQDLDLVTDIPVFSPLAVGLLGRMRGGDFTPNFSVDLIEKDLGYMAELAAEEGVDAAVISAVRNVFTRASTQGLGGQDFSVIGK
jgi:3-hydroxyisobutyrate dehydrogenase-like beta-hydroxyacid dehydrogenase